MDTKEVIATIKNIRKERKMTQLTLATELGISKAQYSHYETYKSSMTLETFFKILDIFEIEIEDFIKINKNDLSTKDIDEIILMLENLKGKMSNVKLTVQ
jgi:transcriptional regulator with XRE-family HTH domain